jgi:hypothetical protein
MVDFWGEASEVAHEQSISIFCAFLMEKYDPRIYDAHHGRLWAVQNEGWGATLCLSLPVIPGLLQ